MFSFYISPRRIFTILSIIGSLLPSLAFAQAPCAVGTYRLIAPVGGMTQCLTLMQYLNGIFLVVIGIAGVLAVVMIVICGIKMMMSGSVSGKSEAKGCVTNAVFGLLIALGAWAILYTINPDLLKNEQSLISLPPQVTGTAGGVRAVDGYTFNWAPGAGCPAINGSLATIVPPSNCPAGGGGTCCGYIALPSATAITSPGRPLPLPPLATNPPLTPPAAPVPAPSPLPTPRPISPPAPRPNPVPRPIPPPLPPPPAVNINAPTVTIAGDATVFSGVPLIPISFLVTEDTQLRTVWLRITNTITGGGTLSRALCSPATRPSCPPTGWSGTEIIDFSSFGNGPYKATIRACDSGGQCTSTSVDITYAKGCTSSTDARCKSDYLALQACIGKAISGACVKADLNLDGAITDADLFLLTSAASLFDMNADGRVDTTQTVTNKNSTCFFFTAQDALLPCALRIIGDITITGTELINFQTLFNAAMLTPNRILLSTLNTNLCSRFPCTTPGAGLGGTDQLSIYGEAMFTTISQYDFNGDGVVDWNNGSLDMLFFQSCITDPTKPGCTKADVNRDGFITNSDMNFLFNIGVAWPTVTTTLSKMEQTFWNGAFQPEAGIISVCTGANPPQLLCASADVNKDGAVNSADLTALQAADKYDIDSNGVVVYAQTPSVPVPINATIPPVVTSTTFAVGNRVMSTTNIIVRSVAGNAQPFVGSLPASIQGVITGGPVFVDNNWWWPVSFDGGMSGWTVEPTLRLATSTPPPPPPPPASGVSTKFKMGELVASTANLNVRTSASLTSAFVALIPANTTRGNITGGPIFADGYWWWQTAWASGVSGWSVENYMKELTPPVAPNITLPTQNSYLPSRTVTISGTMPAAEVDGTVRVWLGATLLGNSQIDTAGRWAITTTLTDGAYTITAVATDQSLNVGPSTAGRTFTIDTIPPAAPIVTSPAQGSTVTSSFTLTGTAEPGSTVSIYADTNTGTLLGIVTTSGSGSWSFARSGYIDGNYVFAVTQKDRAGNTSPVTIRGLIVFTPPPPPPPPPVVNPPPGNFAMNCTDGFMQTAGSYHLLNDQWGKAGVVGFFEQCTGMGPLNPDGSMSGRWTWVWPAGPNEVKGWPSVIFGQKPGRAAAPGSGLPRQVNTLNSVLSTWNTTSTFTGTGHLTFDLWLTRDPVLYGNFPMTPITHEIMVALEPYNGYGLPANRNPAWFVENVTLGGVPYAFYRADNFGCCGLWRFLVFQNLSPRPSGSLEFKVLFDYLVARGHILGTEYLSSVEFGTEAVEGTGDVTVNSFKTTVY